MTWLLNIMLSLTFLFLRSRYLYLSLTSSRVSLDVWISNGICLYTLPSISTVFASSSIVPVGIFGLYVSSSLCSTIPSMDTQSSFVIPSRSDVSLITTWSTPYISRRSINDTPPWSRIFSTHPATLSVCPTSPSVISFIVLLR